MSGNKPLGVARAMRHLIRHGAQLSKFHRQSGGDGIGSDSVHPAATGNPHPKAVEAGHKIKEYAKHIWGSLKNAGKSLARAPSSLKNAIQNYRHHTGGATYFTPSDSDKMANPDTNNIINSLDELSSVNPDDTQMVYSYFTKFIRSLAEKLGIQTYLQDADGKNSSRLSDPIRLNNLITDIISKIDAKLAALEQNASEMEAQKILLADAGAQREKDLADFNNKYASQQSLFNNSLANQESSFESDLQAQTASLQSDIQAKTAASEQLNQRLAALEAERDQLLQQVNSQKSMSSSSSSSDGSQSQSQKSEERKYESDSKNNQSAPSDSMVHWPRNGIPKFNMMDRIPKQSKEDEQKEMELLFKDYFKRTSQEAPSGQQLGGVSKKNARRWSPYVG
jgi:hypothetical protein